MQRFPKDFKLVLLLQDVDRSSSDDPSSIPTKIKKHKSKLILSELSLPPRGPKLKRTASERFINVLPELKPRDSPVISALSLSPRNPKSQRIISTREWTYSRKLNLNTKFSTISPSKNKNMKSHSTRNLYEISKSAPTISSPKHMDVSLAMARSLKNDSIKSHIDTKRANNTSRKTVHFAKVFQGTPPLKVNSTKERSRKSSPITTYDQDPQGTPPKRISPDLRASDSLMNSEKLIRLQEQEDALQFLLNNL